jgi:hypothetical protein
MVVVRVGPPAIRMVVAVVMLLVMSPLFGTTAQAASSNPADMLQEVKEAKQRYNAVDNQGVGLDTAKIIARPGGGYLAVYHHLIANAFQVRLARSENLMVWHDAITLENAASQPTIAALSDGGFVVAYEKRGAGATCAGSGSCLGFRYYANSQALVTNSYDWRSGTVVLNRTLSTCHEGTPNIYAATLNPDIRHSVISVGFHYHRDCQLDQQAQGTLTNFSAWTAQPDSNLNTLFSNYGPPKIQGHVGDRDAFSYQGRPYSLIEAQSTKDDFRTWRPYLFDRNLNSLTMLTLKTRGGSTSFGNPTYTELKLPSGKLGFVSTEFIFSEGAASGEAGELIYYSAFSS